MEAAAIAMVGGGILQAGSTYSQGQAASRNANIAANQLEQNARAYEFSANSEEGVSQKRASEIKRQNKLLQSRQIALAASGGADTSDKNVSDLIIKTEAEGEYSALASLFEGSNRANQLRNQAIGLKNQASATRYEGKQARKAANIGAVTSLLNTAGNAGTFYSKYGSRSPMDTNDNYSSNTASQYNLDF